MTPPTFVTLGAGHEACGNGETPFPNGFRRLSPPEHTGNTSHVPPTCCPLNKVPVASAVAPGAVPIPPVASDTLGHGNTGAGRIPDGANPTGGIPRTSPFPLTGTSPLCNPKFAKPRGVPRTRITTTTVPPVAFHSEGVKLPRANGVHEAPRATAVPFTSARSGVLGIIIDKKLIATRKPPGDTLHFAHAAYHFTTHPPHVRPTKN